MRYSSLTELALEEAKRQRSKLKESENRLYWLEMRRPASDQELLFYKYANVPVRKAISKFSEFNFAGLRKLDKFVDYGENYDLRKSQDLQHEAKNDAAAGVLSGLLGSGSLTLSLSVLPQVIAKFPDYSTSQKIGAAAIELLLISAGLAFIGIGVKKGYDAINKHVEKI